MKPAPHLLTPALLAAFAPLAAPAHGAPQLPSGYAVVTSTSLDLDGKPGPEHAYLVLPISGESTPRLWVYRGGSRALDWGFTRFNIPGTLGSAATRSQAVLQAQDITGDGRPELLVRVVARAGKQSQAATYVFGWDGARFRNLLATDFALTPALPPVRALAHSGAGGAAIRPLNGRPELVVWDREKTLKAGAPARMVAQFFSWNGWSFVPGRSMRSGKPGKAGLQELGLHEATVPAGPGQANTPRLIVTRARPLRPVCDQD